MKSDMPQNAELGYGKCYSRGTSKMSAHTVLAPGGRYRHVVIPSINEPHHEKTCLRRFATR